MVNRIARLQAYLGREIDNIVSGCNLIVNDLKREPTAPLTVERICRFNELVLTGLDVGEETTPGAIRGHSVGKVGK